jgi:dolichol-phosphate mannosyltransferase
MKPAVIVPTYNERDNIDILLDDLLSLPVDLSVINVDDNSPDGTGEAADAWAARYPNRVQVVHRAGMGRYGTSRLGARSN